MFWLIDCAISQGVVSVQIGEVAWSELLTISRSMYQNEQRTIYTDLIA
jgi:hypothetical protein